jgi:ABC-type transport system involved in multi-copper enzyme maturation permease subunit
MIDALRYEIVRLRTIRSTYWLIGIALGLQLVISTLIAWAIPSSGPQSGGDRSFALLATIGGAAGFPLFIAYVLGLLGVFSMGHEYRHGMIRATLTALRSRVAVLAAKTVVTTVVSAAVAFTCALLALVIALPFGIEMPTFGGFREVTLGMVIYTALFALSGMAFAAITRNQTAAVALILLLPSVIEEVAKGVLVIIRAVSDEPVDQGGMAAVLKFLPYDAGSQMYTQFSIDDLLEVFGVTSFGAVGGGLVMATFVAILLAASTALFLKRDA